MILLPQTIIQIVASGGGLVIDLEKTLLMPNTMIQIAATAAHSGAKVTFKVGNTVVMPQTMAQVAVAGKSNVTFDIS